MSNRTSVKSAFEGLRPSIVREPARTLIAPQDESKLLAATPIQEERPEFPSQHTQSHVAAFQHAGLLTKKKREVLVPVTFRIPQTLKDQLTEVAKKHELNQTDLINEGILLNLQRYR